MAKAADGLGEDRAMLRFRLRNDRQAEEFEHAAGPIEFGRGGPQNNVPRRVIQDQYVSGNHVSVLELPDGRINVTNLSARNNIRLADGVIPVGGTRQLPVPVRLTVGETILDIEPVGRALAPPAPVPVMQEAPPPYEPESETADFEGPLQTIGAPLSPRTMAAAAQPSLLDLGGAPSPEKLAQWFETVIAVQRAAAGSAEFFRDTARAIVSLVGLDKGLVILRKNNRPMVAARCPDDDGGMSRGREFSMTIWNKVRDERRTFYQSEGTAAVQSAESLAGVEAVVAAPIIDARDQVIGMVYGSRTKYSRQRGGVGIGALEAQVMQLLAAAVGAGLARQEQEAEANKLRVQFEQFFSADLARELQRDPRMLEGKEREVTVMFGDIRGFSQMSKDLGPADICRVVSSVMDKMTNRIMEHEGVVVDYAGDGIMAMWNAPGDVKDHAAKAVRAALAMLGDLPELNRTWKEELGERLKTPIKIGIGLNTGTAMCGNTGCGKRFKYGPLGHPVNLASRVEGATKLMGVPLLITQETREKLGDGFETRRLGRIKVVGIDVPVNLYEVHVASGVSAEWKTRRDTYEKAVVYFENAATAATAQAQRQCFRDACRALYSLFVPDEEEHDAPGLTLSALAIEALKSPPENFSGVIELKSKG
jgi:adenylate cyclase